MQTPFDVRPQITNKNITDNSVTRYFVQSISTTRIYEVDKRQYDWFTNTPYYTTVKLPWIIVGNMETKTLNGHVILSVEEQNKNIVEYYNQKMPGLKHKLRNFTEYYVQS